MKEAVARQFRIFKDSSAEITERLRALDYLKISEEEDIQKAILFHITDPNYNIREKVADYLRTLGERTVELCTKYYEELTIPVIVEVLDLLHTIRGESAHYFVLDQLSHGDNRVRGAACLAIGAMRFEDDLYMILPLLEEDDEVLRIKVIRSLGMLQDPVAIFPMMKLFEDTILAPYVVDAMVNIGEEAVMSLEFALKERDTPPFKKYLILEALSRMKTESALSILHEHLHANERALRRISIWAVGQIGSAKSVPALLEVLKSDKLFVKHVEEALNNIYPFDIQLLTDVYHELHDEGQKCLLRVMREVRDKESIEFLVEKMERESTEKLRLIIEALAALGFEASFVTLLYHSNNLLRRLVLKIIPRGAGEFPFFAVRRLAIRSRDWKVRYRALYSLFLKGRSLTRGEMRRFLHDKNIFINVLALFILSKEKTPGGVKAIRERLISLTKSTKYTTDEYNFFLTKALYTLKSLPTLRTLDLLLQRQPFSRSNRDNLELRDQVLQVVVKLLRHRYVIQVEDDWDEDRLRGLLRLFRKLEPEVVR